MSACIEKFPAYLELKRIKLELITIPWSHISNWWLFTLPHRIYLGNWSEAGTQSKVAIFWSHTHTHTHTHTEPSTLQKCQWQFSVSIAIKTDRTSKSYSYEQIIGLWIDKAILVVTYLLLNPWRQFWSYLGPWTYFFVTSSHSWFKPFDAFRDIVSVTSCSQVSRYFHHFWLADQLSFYSIAWLDVSILSTLGYWLQLIRHNFKLVTHPKSLLWSVSYCLVHFWFL